MNLKNCTLPLLLLFFFSCYPDHIEPETIKEEPIKTPIWNIYNFKDIQYDPQSTLDANIRFEMLDEIEMLDLLKEANVTM